MSRNRNNQDKLYESKKKELQNMLRQLEDKIYSLETIYLSETSNYGNVLVGWESYFNSKFLKSNAQVSNKKASKIYEKDRLFSLASVNSKASEKLREETEKNMNSSNYDTSSHTGFVKKRIKKRNRDKANHEGNKRGQRKEVDYEEDDDYSVDDKVEKSRKKSKSGKDSSNFREQKNKHKKKKNNKKH